MRTRKNERLDTRTERMKLEHQKEPYWVVLEKGRSLGYRKGLRSGEWVARLYDPLGKPRHRQHGLGSADDFADADGVAVLSFSQAQAAARAWFKVAHHVQAVGDLTVADAVEAYLQEKERQGSRTVARTRTDFACHVLPVLGPVALARVTPPVIKGWLDGMAAKGRQRRHRDPDPPPATAEERQRRRATANRIWTSLRAALNLAAETHGLERPWAGAKAFRGTQVARVRFLTQDEQLRLLAACSGSFRDLVQAALLTGAREGELARVTLADYQGGQLWIAPGKTGAGRWVILDQAGIEFFSGLSAPLHRAPGKPWLSKSVMAYLAEACEAAGITPLTFHELRHTYASTLLNRGVPLVYVAAQLGHRDTRMVEKHYGHLCRVAMASAIRG